MQFCTIEFGSDLYNQECKIRHEILRKPLGLNLYYENFNLEANYYHFGFLEKEKLVSCVVAIPIDELTIKFRQILVIPSFQRLGIGTKMMSETEKYLAELNFSQFELNARKSAIDFYKRIGYQIIGSEFIEINTNIIHVKMIKYI